MRHAWLLLAVLGCGGEKRDTPDKSTKAVAPVAAPAAEPIADYVAEKKRLQGECDTGKHASCRELAWLSLNDLGGVGNIVQARDWIEAACRNDDAPACALQHYTLGYSVTEEQGKADAACKAGDRRACALLAPSAVEACERGDLAVCDAAGRGKRPPAELCKAGVVRACADLASRGDKDAATRGCALGHAKSCELARGGFAAYASQPFPQRNHRDLKREDGPANPHPWFGAPDKRLYVGRIGERTLALLDDFGKRPTLVLPADADKALLEALARTFGDAVSVKAVEQFDVVGLDDHDNFMGGDMSTNVLYREGTMYRPIWFVDRDGALFDLVWFLDNKEAVAFASWRLAAPDVLQPIAAAH